MTHIDTIFWERNDLHIEPIFTDDHKNNKCIITLEYYLNLNQRPPMFCAPLGNNLLTSQLHIRVPDVRRAV